MSKSRKPHTATLRLKQDYLRLKKDPVPYVVAEPIPSNILEWHYVVRGPENTPYEGGMYLGKLVFPREFPFKPPSIYMSTPNGRFKTNTRLCLSISDFHPDTWNPAWSVSTILTGLLSFMLEKSPTLGSMETSEFERRQLAAQSLEFNLKNTHFCDLFPDLVDVSNCIVFVFICVFIIIKRFSLLLIVLVVRYTAETLTLLNSVSKVSVTTGHDYLQAHLHLIGLAEDHVCPLCLSSRMDGGHLLTYPVLHHLPNDISLRYWAAQRQIAKRPRTGSGDAMNNISYIWVSLSTGS